MRIEHLALRHITSLDAVDLDLTDLPTGLIAITGENGAGKTTLLESVVGALYRTLPSRAGELKDYATARDSFLEARVAVDGVGVFRARVSIDGDKGTSDAILEHQGVPLNDGKVSTFDAAVRERFPSLPVLLASAVALQNKRGNFIGKKPRERKDLFAELLGLQAYEGMSQTAKTLVSMIDRERERLRITIDELTRLTADEVSTRLANMAALLMREDESLQADRRHYAAVTAMLDANRATHQRAVTEHAAARARADVLQQELARAQEELRTLDDRRRAALDAGGLQRIAVEARVAAAEAAVTARCSAAVEALETKIASYRQTLAQAEAIRNAVETLSAVEARVTALRTALDAATAESVAARETRRDKERQLAGFAHVAQQLTTAQLGAQLIETVPFGAQCAEAQCRFLTDAIDARDHIPVYQEALVPKPRVEAAVAHLTQAIDAHQATVAALTKEQAQLTAERTTAQALAAQADTLIVAETRLAECLRALETTEEEHVTRLAELGMERQQRLREVDARAVETDAGLLARHDAVETQLRDRQGELTAAEQVMAMSASAYVEAAQLDHDIAEAHELFDAAGAELAAVAVEQKNLARERDALEQQRARRDALLGHLSTLDTERTEWAHLQQALGRDGVPVLEMDAAGPRISALTNELLTSCFGARFSVELTTQLARADGKGFKESFSLMTTDNERGGVREVGDLSGGEQIIVSESLMCAISIFVNSRTPMPVRSVFRDETVGALDPENGVRYIEMLRRMMALGDYSHIYFVSHSAALSSLADAQIHVSDGTARIALPPYGEAAA